MMALRITGGTAKAPFVPSEDWIEAFTAQMDDPEFHHAVWRYAERRGRMVGHARKLDPDLYATELVQDILDDTLQGAIAWDPARVSLKKHVYDAIKSRSRHHYLRAIRLRHLSLDDDFTARLVDEQTAIYTRETEIEKAERLQSVASVIDLVRERVADDPEMQRIFDAYDRGCVSRAEILEVAGLTKLQYDAARKRLDRLIEELPSQLITRARNR